MSKRQRVFLAITILTWIAYFICTLIFGHGLWIVKVLSLAFVIILGIYLFTDWESKENGFGD
ncbi:hypothetical protein MKY34_08040 [Sporosarcina sp. FSL K6-1522]|uniref:hypothetical protein n=1 Tax=Sporosarcina sp. FSL K6-1522 TaxID=2921554 RepID=UPI00315A5AB1